MQPVSCLFLNHKAVLEEEDDMEGEEEELGEDGEEEGGEEDKGAEEPAAKKAKKGLILGSGRSCCQQSIPRGAWLAAKLEQPLFLEQFDEVSAQAWMHLASQQSGWTLWRTVLQLFELSNARRLPH